MPWFQLNNTKPSGVGSNHPPEENGVGNQPVFTVCFIMVVTSQNSSYSYWSKNDLFLTSSTGVLPPSQPPAAQCLSVSWLFQPPAAVGPRRLNCWQLVRRSVSRLRSSAPHESPRRPPQTSFGRPFFWTCLVQQIIPYLGSPDVKKQLTMSNSMLQVVAQNHSVVMGNNTWMMSFVVTCTQTHPFDDRDEARSQSHSS